MPRRGASSALRPPPAGLPLYPRARPARLVTVRPLPPSGPCLMPWWPGCGSLSATGWLSAPWRLPRRTYWTGLGCRDLGLALGDCRSRRLAL
eukprot:2281592-Alexandrium_andersonii.AAC.1